MMVYNGNVFIIINMEMKEPQGSVVLYHKGCINQWLVKWQKLPHKNSPLDLIIGPTSSFVIWRGVDIFSYS